MPRINKVGKARRAQGACSKCGKHIKVGDGYLYWKFYRGGRIVRCLDSACYPRPQDLTRSEHWIQVYDIQDQIANATGPEDVDDIAAAIEQLRDDTQEKLDNMPYQLQDGDTGVMLQERVEALEAWQNLIENIDQEQDDFLDCLQESEYEGE